MASREAIKRTVQHVRPILSVDKDEAKKRALNLYKAWYRQIPYIGMLSNINYFFKFNFCLVILLCHSSSIHFFLIFLHLVKDYDIPVNIEQCRAKLREEFLKHENVTDIRVIDMLVIKVSAICCCCRFLSRFYLMYIFFSMFTFVLGSNGVKRKCSYLETKGTYYEILERESRT